MFPVAFPLAQAQLLKQESRCQEHSSQGSQGNVTDACLLSDGLSYCS